MTMPIVFIPATFRSAQPSAAERDKGSFLPLQPPLGCCEVFAIQTVLARELSLLGGFGSETPGRVNHKGNGGENLIPQHARISAEVKHAPDKGMSCPVLYPDQASAGHDK